MSNKTQFESVQLLTDKEVAALFNVSQNHVWVMAKNPKFPKPIKLSKNITRWRLVDIKTYIDGLFSSNEVHKVA
jgi:predicted DNA-binding transcriptional regulator AlpA